MKRFRMLSLVVAIGLGAAFLAACSSSSKSSTSSPTTAAGVTAPSTGGGTTVNITLSDTKGLDAPMTLTPSTATAPAGNVTFVIKNSGTIEHEMLVLKTDTPFDQIPVADSGDPPSSVATGADKIDEKDVVEGGDTGDTNLKAGETRTITVKGLAAGKYVLACNIAKHYQLGMRAAFTVS